MGISTTTLARWQKPAEQKALLRGQSSKYSDVQIAFVVQTWKRYTGARKKVKFKAFMKALRKNWKSMDWAVDCPSRKTVEDMLWGNDVRQPKSSRPKAKPVAKVKTFFPNAQVLLDGKQVEVTYKGQTYVVILELCKDIASGANTGMAVGTSESYELVKKALAAHGVQHGDPGAVLTDNGSANKRLAIDLGAEGKLVLHARPRRPQTKGHIEGEFSMFEKKVSRIEIQGQTDQEIAMSLVKVVAQIYLKLRNKTPRCTTCPLTPEKLMHYRASDLEREKAWRILAAEKEKKRAQQEMALKIATEKLELIDSIVKEHALSGDRMLLKKSLRHVELAIIREAEQHFYVQSQRDTFDERKRSMAYFCKIALNLQKERDQARRQEMARRRYGLDAKARQLRQARQEKLDLAAQNQRYQKYPHELIRESFESYRLLPDPLKMSTAFWRLSLDDAIDSIKNRRNPRQQQALIDRAREVILEQHKAPLDLRYEFINKIETRMIQYGLNVAKCVTPF